MLTSPNPDTATTNPKNVAAVACDIPAFCRNHYYRGKLLTERDFAAEQQYHRDKMRLHTLALHGWGVVCGFEVKPHPYCPDQRLVVGEGFAIDCCGREIRVVRPVELALPPAPPAPPPPVDRGRPRPDFAGRPPEPDPGHGEPAPIAKELYLCIVYTECETEYSPAPFDDCNCVGGSSLQPNRVCEGFRLDLHETKPEFWNEAVERRCEADDCRELFGEGCEPCRQPGECCVPLAIIADFVPGRKVSAEQIRVRGYRRELASTETLDRVLRCVLDKLPATELTRIDDFNWEHGQRYLCREFISDYVSSHDHPRGFRIRFTDKVRSRAIDSRSFQAYVIFHSEDRAQPRHMEYVPIEEIHKDEDATDWCRLSIDRNYANQRLDSRDFDFFVVLRCDVISDLHGLAVDGNFLNAALPTGDMVPGGTFESWIEVRSRRAERF